MKYRDLYSSIVSWICIGTCIWLFTSVFGYSLFLKNQCSIPFLPFSLFSFFLSRSMTTLSVSWYSHNANIEKTLWCYLILLDVLFKFIFLFSIWMISSELLWTSHILYVCFCYSLWHYFILFIVIRKLQHFSFILFYDFCLSNILPLFSVDVFIMLGLFVFSWSL